MFDIGALELLIVVVVAILVIGPKDMPMALRAAGRWIGKARRMSNHFRAGIDSMIREAELEEAEKEWRERNARIMADDGKTGGDARDADDRLVGPEMEPLVPPPERDADAAAEAAIERSKPRKAPSGDGPSSARADGTSGEAG